MAYERHELFPHELRGCGLNGWMAKDHLTETSWG